MPPNSATPKLPPYEWAAILISLGILLFIATTAIMKQPPPPPHESENSLIIKIVGEVEKPGYHMFPQGTCLKDIIGVVKPKRDTEAQGVEEDTELADGQTIRFKSLLVKVRVKGAVTSPAELKMRKGSVLADYLDRLDLTEDADTAKVHNRLIKRQNQTITIPRKRA